MLRRAETSWTSEPGCQWALHPGTGCCSQPLPLPSPLLQACPVEAGNACPRVDNSHSGNFVNFACAHGHEYNDLATIFFNTQVGGGGQRGSLVPCRLVTSMCRSLCVPPGSGAPLGILHGHPESSY